jgi:hypothetical protein
MTPAQIAEAQKLARGWKPTTQAKKNDGAPGSDGVTFEAIEAQGVETFLGQIADELVGRNSLSWSEDHSQE